jgi:hypothetical protein
MIKRNSSGSKYVSVLASNINDDDDNNNNNNNNHDYSLAVVLFLFHELYCFFRIFDMRYSLDYTVSSFITLSSVALNSTRVQRKFISVISFLLFSVH